MIMLMCRRSLNRHADPRPSRVPPVEVRRLHLPSIDETKDQQGCQLDDNGRRSFGQITLWLTLGIEGVLTMGITVLAVHLRIGIPPPNSTQIAEVARSAQSSGLFGAFQATTALLLLAAASSSLQAGPGLLKALSRHVQGGQAVGILSAILGSTNKHHTPYWGLLLYSMVSALVVVAAQVDDQQLVLFYAVAVFMSFLAGLLAMTHCAFQEHRATSLLINKWERNDDRCIHVAD